MIYQSTKALSVYNALSITRRNMSREQVDAFLRGALDVNLSIDYVTSGVDYLVDRQFVAEVDGVLTIERLPNGLGRPLLRCNEDRDLMLGVG